MKKYLKRIESTNTFLMLKSFIMGYLNNLLLRLRIGYRRYVRTTIKI